MSGYGSDNQDDDDYGTSQYGGYYGGYDEEDDPDYDDDASDTEEESEEESENQDFHLISSGLSAPLPVT